MSEMRNPGAGQATGAHEIHAVDQAQSSSIPLLSAVLSAENLAPIRTVLRFARPDDVRLIDAPTAAALDVALDMVDQGRQPTAVALHAELLRLGGYAGNAGEQVRNRVIAATSPAEPPERLPEFAAAVLAEVYRAKFAALAYALDTMAETAAESELWVTLEREGRAIRAVRDSLTALRQHSGAVSDD
ncbi:hypothetical protein MYK68_04060 [Gordonia sp. PP30]|uniref:hypothetical protein n=1 Tax=Gordonia sp. PP30 TaxID=2935861 RepID=UPI001FFE5CA3|nr:hypothetical protein [Gordonia sp. PP30]UQE75794.1 hypothetical protein MYK68_04060 [Gordonia sp. PP30]